MEPKRNGSNASARPTSVVNAVRRSSNNSLLTTILVVLLIITSVVTSAYLVTRLVTSGADGNAVKAKQYQALFLTNGQVYFGHLTGINNDYVKLTTIYYLQVQQQVQPGQTQNSQQPNVSLAKLGNELHGPEDSMYVSRTQVLFWENLKDSGKVVQAIQSYQKNGSKTP
jgi:hypothetical protein